MMHRLISTLALLLLPAFASQAQPVRISDDHGRDIVLPGPAQRIVSLAPHVTELLFAAGAGRQVVGAVDYSDHPPTAGALPRVGGYHRIDIETVLSLRPDVVIGWGEGNRPAELEQLRAAGLAVFVNDPHTLDDIARSLEHFGTLAGTADRAQAAARAFRQRRDALAARYARGTPVRVFYQLWNTPLMTAGGAHLISSVIELCGGRNVFAALAAQTPSVGVESVLAADPQVIIASGMDTARPEWLDDWRRWPTLQAVRAGHLFHISPELIQRHSPRVLDGAQRLCEQLEGTR